MAAPPQPPPPAGTRQHSRTRSHPGTFGSCSPCPLPPGPCAPNPGEDEEEEALFPPHADPTVSGTPPGHHRHVPVLGAPRWEDQSPKEGNERDVDDTKPQLMPTLIWPTFTPFPNPSNPPENQDLVPGTRWGQAPPGSPAHAAQPWGRGTGPQTCFSPTLPPEKFLLAWAIHVPRSGHARPDQLKGSKNSICLHHLVVSHERSNGAELGHAAHISHRPQTTFRGLSPTPHTSPLPKGLRGHLPTQIGAPQPCSTPENPPAGIGAPQNHPHVPQDPRHTGRRAQG